MKRIGLILVVLFCAVSCTSTPDAPAAAPAAKRGDVITVATYNVELFDHHFMAHHAATQPISKNSAAADILAELRKKNDEDNWETAQVILDPSFSPDILVIEEGCDEADLKFFNHRWLNDAYETVIQFPSNSDRHQQLELLMKKGFTILEKRDKYYLEPDPVGNERGARLFARGPAFVKVRTPGGYEFWVGVTHMKSKNVASVGEADASGKESAATRQRKIEVTKWRNREAVRTHRIIKELEKAGPSDVMLLGDMNDSLGFDPYEHDGGGDAIANLVGPPEDGLTLVTRRLAEAKEHSFNGYWRTGFRELIDHVVVTPSMKDRVEDVKVFQDNWTAVSSDHFPVMVKFRAK